MILTRYLSIFILILGIGMPVTGQVITTDPEFPTSDQSVTITYDATEGTAGLKDFSGDVYAHTGVITDQSSNDSDWKYVVTEWAENIPKIKMTRVEPNIYELEITPSIREYYGVPESETIEKMAFVFRNSDGSMEGKAEGGNDIFAQVYQSSFNVKFSSPSDTLTFRKTDEPLSLVGVAASENSSNIELTLLKDGQQIANVSDDTLRYTYQPQTGEKVRFALAGYDGTERDTAYTTLIVYTEPADVDRPAGLEDGITYVDGSTVRFSLFAPHKEFAYLIGDFNDWQIEPNYFMNRDSVNADSVYFWMEINGLTPGEEYGFQYLVDGDLRVADPYSEKILDPGNDRHIMSSTYPGLKPYPHGKTEHLVGVMHPGHPPYNWQHTGYDRPDREDLVIYELLVRDFVKNHDFNTVTDSLDYLKRLGVNAIELMPVMEFDANSSWGYNPTFHVATDKYYGPANDLRRLIDEAHARGMVVILDMVLNHAWGPSPLVRLWNDGDFGKPTPQNPYLNREPKHDFNVGYDFNHESRATQYFVDRVNRYWLEEFKFDGYRFDLSKGFTQKNTLGNVGAWGQYDASRVRLLKRMADAIWAVDDSAYVILEHFADNSEEQELADYGMMLWGNQNHSYNEATMGYHDNGKSNFSGISYQQRNWSVPHLVGYMESHDEERLMYKNLQFGNSFGEYDITELNTALDRNKMAAAFFFTIPGPKMFWQFGELGYDVSIDENGRTGEKPILWEYYSDEARKKLYDTFRALIRLRNAHPAFTSEESEISLDLQNAAKRITLRHPDMEVSIIGNFGVQEMSKRPDFAVEGTWYEYFSGDTVEVADRDTSITLAPGEFHIYTTQKFEQPEGNLVPGSGTDGPPGNGGGSGEIPETFELHQNYPNPFNPSTTIPYDLPETAKVTLRVFNILGQEVLTQNLGEQQPGTNKEIRVNFSSLSTGVYIYRLQAGSEVSSRKMVFIK
ncbi:MAG: alpha-amylase family glycosyl hydrolase [Balneolaceae bacterium]|nr:alpha-amylase family glycosyl hydrolase [Balneolaceae bacterium]